MDDETMQRLELTFEEQQEIDRIAKKAYTPGSNANKARYNLYAYIESLVNGEPKDG